LKEYVKTSFHDGELTSFVLCLKDWKQISALWVNSEIQLVMPCVSNVILYITVLKLRLS